MRKTVHLINQMVNELEDCAILLLDENGTIITWNKGVEKINGYSAGDILSKHFDMFFTEEERKKKLPQVLLRTAVQQGRCKNECWRLKKNGSRFWASSLLTVIRNTDNKVIGFSNIVRDLTDKKNAEEAEKFGEKFGRNFFKIFDASPVGMILTELESAKIVQINKFFLETFGYKREEVIGFTPDELGILSFESRQRMGEKWRRNNYLKNERVTYISKAGEEINCIVSTDLFEMEGQHYLLSAYHNISGRLKAEETEKALAQSRLGFMKLFNASPSGMTLADIESGRLLEANGTFLKIFNYTHAEVIGFTGRELGFISEHAYVGIFAKLKMQGYLRNENLSTQTKDGRKIEASFSVEQIEFDGRQCFLSIFHDVTELKEMARRVKESEIKYRKITEEAGDVLYTSDSEGRFTYINPRGIRLTEYSETELLGRHFSMLIAPEWAERVAAIYQEQFLKNIPETRAEFVILTKSGKPKWVEQVVIMQTEQGVVKGFQSVAHDITERKNASNLLGEQKLIIEQKNKDILDSIIYAKRIQDAIFPPQALVNELLPKSFILFKPKEVISGDFYWVEKFNNKVFIAAVDCTGHGVPGALLSIIGYNLLSKSINEYGYSHPDQILNELSNGINTTLRKTKENLGIKDTMDIALCSIDYETNTLEYAGAHNSLYIVRKNELIKLPANRFPIGVFANGELQKFTNHKMQLQKDDMIYLFTDGYPDQFGGPAGKKLMYKGFRSSLLSVYDLPITEQKNALNTAIEAWRSETEDQTDDILVIGIRI